MNDKREKTTRKKKRKVFIHLTRAYHGSYHYYHFESHIHRRLPAFFASSELLAIADWVNERREQLVREVALDQKIIPASLPRAEARELVVAFAFKHYSMLLGAPQKRQDQLIGAFNDMLDQLERKYPHLDLESYAFRVWLNQAAKEWWQSRPMSGKAVDW